MGRMHSTNKSSNSPKELLFPYYLYARKERDLMAAKRSLDVERIAKGWGLPYSKEEGPITYQLSLTPEGWDGLLEYNMKKQGEAIGRLAFSLGEVEGLGKLLLIVTLQGKKGGPSLPFEDIIAFLRELKRKGWQVAMIHPKQNYYVRSNGSSVPYTFHSRYFRKGKAISLSIASLDNWLSTDIPNGQELFFFPLPSTGFPFKKAVKANLL